MTTNNLHFAQLGITSGKLWLLKYPNLITSFTTANDYLGFHQNYRALVLQQNNMISERMQITNELDAINTEIRTSIKFVKGYLAEFYGNNAKSYYLAYGLVFENNKHIIAKDNDKRMLALDILVKALQDSSNLLSSQKYGLSYWSAIQVQHRAVWTAAKTLDGTISINSANLKQMKGQAIVLQKSLRAQIRVDFATNYKSVIRDFGFQD